MENFKLNGPSAVITPDDVRRLLDRLESAHNAILRNVLYGMYFRDDPQEMAGNIRRDIQDVVVKAWAQTIFPDQFKGKTTGEGGQFSWESFEFFEARKVVDDLFNEDKIDKMIIAQKRKALDARDAAALKAGEPVFRAAKNYVSCAVQLNPGLRSTEEETKEWIQSLDFGGAKAYGVFSDVLDVTQDVTLVPFGEEEPVVEKLAFLGWLFVRSDKKPRINLGDFLGLQGAVVGIDEAVLSDEVLQASNYRRTTGHPWHDADL